MAQRHPLAETLHKLRQNKYATTEELEETLHWAQLETEKGWESGEFQRILGLEKAKNRTCGREGCNHSRYPASNFCMYHTSGHDTFAARFRRSKQQQK
jgi:hypothetical protein